MQFERLREFDPTDTFGSLLVSSGYAYSTGHGDYIGVGGDPHLAMRVPEHLLRAVQRIPVDDCQRKYRWRMCVSFLVLVRFFLGPKVDVTLNGVGK